MADQLDIAGLSMKDSQHANGFPRSTYIPPHMRGQMGGPAGPPGPLPRMDGPPPMMNGGMNGSAWAGPQTYVPNLLACLCEENH